MAISGSNCFFGRVIIIKYWILGFLHFWASPCISTWASDSRSSNKIIQNLDVLLIAEWYWRSDSVPFIWSSHGRWQTNGPSQTWFVACIRAFGAHIGGGSCHNWAGWQFSKSCVDLRNSESRLDVHFWKHTPKPLSQPPAFRSLSNFNQVLIQSDGSAVRLVCPTTQCHRQVLEICHTTNPGVNRHPEYQLCVKTLGSWSWATWPRSLTCLTILGEKINEHYLEIIFLQRWLPNGSGRGVVLSISR